MNLIIGSLSHSVAHKILGDNFSSKYYATAAFAFRHITAIIVNQPTNQNVILIRERRRRNSRKKNK